MSLKAELETWVKALDAYDAQDFPTALSHFESIADSSKVLFNIGLIHATLANHRMAVAFYEQAHLLDQYLAVSFFQCGVSHFLLGDYTAAEQAFSNAYLHMRENQIIDYEQLGLKFRLYSAEILFNQALALINLASSGAGQQAQMKGMTLMDQARKEKQTDEHKVIEEAYAEGGLGFTVFSVPVGVLFRPSPIKLKNLKAKNYLGNAKLVAATDPADAFIGFSGLGGRAASPPLAPASSSKPQLSPIEKLSPIEMARKRSRSVSSGSGSATRPSAKPSTPPPNIPLPVPPLPLSVQAALAKQQHQPYSQNSIRPLKIQKSSPDLKATRPMQEQARPNQLPRLDTNVTRPGIVASANAAVGPGQVYIPAPRKASIVQQPATGIVIATTMLGPPSPPESEYSESPQQQQQQTYDFRDSVAGGHQKQSRRTTSDTTLVYRSNSNAAAIGANGASGRQQQQQYKTLRHPPSAAKRDTEFMEELIGGYSATSLSPLPEQLPPPLAAAPTPQGQPRERVEKWASSQVQVKSQGTLRFATAQTSGLVRNVTNSSSASGQNGLYHAASSRGANRRRAQTDGPGSFLNSRYIEDDGSMGRNAGGMVSFRLKLHFEDDIRGMSLDADTSYADFYTRLQTKFGIADMKLKYQDEDGVFVTLVDETDWDSAVAAAREHCHGGRQDGKLEIWVSEVQ